MSNISNFFYCAKCKKIHDYSIHPMEIKNKIVTKECSVKLARININRKMRFTYAMSYVEEILPLTDLQRYKDIFLVRTKNNPPSQVNPN